VEEIGGGVPVVSISIFASQKIFIGYKLNARSWFYGECCRAKLTWISIVKFETTFQEVQRPVVDESGMIRTNMVTHNKLENCCSAWGALYDTIV
jgi:hypothetical protein